MTRANPRARDEHSRAQKGRAISVLRQHPQLVEGRSNPDRPMTDKQKLLAKAMAMPGMTDLAAARMAGYNPNGAGKMSRKLKHDAAFQKLLEVEHKAYREANMMTRKRVVDGFLRAVELSEVKVDSIAMTAAWREIGRMCGFYAPKVVKHEISLSGEAFKDKLRQMSDDDLMRLGNGEAVLDGDFEIVEDPDHLRSGLVSVS